MDLRQKEVQDGFKWLVCAGSAAILLSLTLFWADNTVMRNAPARDKVHNEELHQLRVAQAGLPGRVTDDRQTLPLVLEEENAKQESASTDQSH
jgi:hypothetical protein